MIISSLITSCILPFSISTSVGAFYLSFFSINCISTFSTLGIKGFVIFFMGISTFFPLISLIILEASVSSVGFPSQVGDTSMMSLLLLVADLLFFFFFSTNRITLTSTIIFFFLLWVFFLVPIDSYFSCSHCFKK